MTTKREAQRQASQVRRIIKKAHLSKTVNVVKLGKHNYGVRCSPKGTRSKFDYHKGRYGHD